MNPPDMIRKTVQEVSPISSFPESETLHLILVVTHRCIAIWCTMQVEVDQFLQIRTDNLVRVDKDDFIQVHGKQNVEEKNFVCPNNSLLFLLGSEPRRPFISHE